MLVNVKRPQPKLYLFEQEVITEPVPTQSVKKGTVVSGEASESDDETEELPSPVVPVPVSIPPLEGS